MLAPDEARICWVGELRYGPKRVNHGETPNLTLRGRLAFALGALKRQVDRDYTVWRELKYAFFGGAHDTMPDSENSEKPEKSHQAGLH